MINNTSGQLIADLKQFISELTSPWTPNDKEQKDLSSFTEQKKTNFQSTLDYFKSTINSFNLDHQEELLDHLNQRLQENIKKTSSKTYFTARTDLLNQFLQLIDFKSFSFDKAFDQKMIDSSKDQLTSSISSNLVNSVLVNSVTGKSLRRVSFLGEGDALRTELVDPDKLKDSDDETSKDIDRLSSIFKDFFSRTKIDQYSGVIQKTLDQIEKEKTQAIESRNLNFIKAITDFLGRNDLSVEEITEIMLVELSSQISKTSNPQYFQSRSESLVSFFKKINLNIDQGFFTDLDKFLSRTPIDCEVVTNRLKKRIAQELRSSQQDQSLQVHQSLQQDPSLQVDQLLQQGQHVLSAFESATQGQSTGLNRSSSSPLFRSLRNTPSQENSVDYPVSRKINIDQQPHQIELNKQQEIESLRQQLADIKKELAEKNKHIEDIETKQSLGSEQITELQSYADHYIRQNQILEKEYRQSNESNYKLRNELEELKKQHKDLIQAGGSVLKFNSEEEKKLNAQIISHQQTILEYQQSMQYFYSQIDTLQLHNTINDELLNEYQRIQQDLAKIIDAIESSCDSIDGDLEKISKQIGIGDGEKFNKLQEQIKDLKESLEALKHGKVQQKVELLDEMRLLKENLDLALKQIEELEQLPQNQSLENKQNRKGSSDIVNEGQKFSSALELIANTILQNQSSVDPDKDQDFHSVSSIGDIEKSDQTNFKELSSLNQKVIAWLPSDEYKEEDSLASIENVKIWLNFDEVTRPGEDGLNQGKSSRDSDSGGDDEEGLQNPGSRKDSEVDQSPLGKVRQTARTFEDRIAKSNKGASDSPGKSPENLTAGRGKSSSANIPINGNS